MRRAVDIFTGCLYLLCFIPCIIGCPPPSRFGPVWWPGLSVEWVAWTRVGWPTLWPSLSRYTTKWRLHGRR